MNTRITSRFNAVSCLPKALFKELIFNHFFMTTGHLSRRYFLRLFAGIFGIAILSASALSDTPTVQSGDLVVPTWSFLEGPPLEVTGEWEVIWGELIAPTDFDQAYKGEHFILPGRWSTADKSGMNGPMGAATFRVRLKLPEHANDVAFHMIAAHSAYRVFIDGASVLENGVVSETPDGFQANYVSRSFAGKSGESVIVMQVANFVHAHAGPGHALTLWDAKRLQRYLDTLSVVYGLVTGILFALGLFQLTIFFSDRKDKTNGPIHLWFSLLCFIIVYRVHGAIPLLHEYFPESGYWDNLRLSYASLYASPAVFLLFFRATFPNEFPKRFTLWIIWLSFAFLAFTLVATEYLYTSTRNFAIPLNVATVFYCLIFTAKAAYASQPGARAILISNFVFLLTAIHDGVIYTDQTTGFDMTPFGILILGLGYSYALMLRLRVTFHEAHETSAALKTLNLELEKKVYERTQDFRTAAAKAENEANERARFISAASHDLRQPVHALSIFNETLKSASTENTELSNIADKQHSLIGSLTEMLDTMLDASRLEAKTLYVNMRTVYLGDVFQNLHDTLQPIAAQANVKLTVVPTTAYIYADPKYLRRVLTNLIVNAINASHGGRVLVGCRLFETTVDIRVVDTGCGIPSGAQKQIFDRYTQLNPTDNSAHNGLGLGLSIVKELCALMKMTISLESVVSKGTNFGVSAARISASTHAIPATESQGAPAPTKRRLIILVIDDMDDAREALVTLFRKWGHSARGISCLEETIETLEDLGKPDLIVADYRLGNNATGLDVIDAIHKKYSDVPAVIVTGSTAPTDLKILEECDHRVFYKPIKPADIKEILCIENSKLTVKN